MAEVNYPSSTQRRRSERISDSLPLIVHGTDLLGQPFDERTTTLNLNLHGCRYTSKHHLPRNTWVTLELPQGSDGRKVRARVAWVQRPHSVRDFFQIAVELESPSNIWGIASPPPGWTSETSPAYSRTTASTTDDFQHAGESPNGSLPATLATFMGKPVNETTNPTKTIPEPSPSVAPLLPIESPFLRELRAEVERQAKEAIESAATQAREGIRQTAEEMEQKRLATAGDFFHQWKEEFEQAQKCAREEFSVQMAARQDEFLGSLKSEFQENISRANDLMSELDSKAAALLLEREAVQETIHRLAEARLQLETAGDVHASGQAAEISPEDASVLEKGAAEWRERLASEMSVAQAQWNELLQSSLDHHVRQLLGRLSERSEEILRSAEEKEKYRLAELQEPFLLASSEAKKTLSSMKYAFEEEVARARYSLTEIENSAGRMKEYSAQLDAASHDTLNELHRRLENSLEAQMAELNRRVDNLAASVALRLAPSLDSLGQEFLGRAIADLESKIAPHLQRVPELLRELTAREVQAEESLRLHRERLRQVSEQNQRETAAQMSSTLANLRGDFEAARGEALANWSKELHAGGIRASQEASESISRASEWFQQEARARLQVLVEQVLASAGTGFEKEISEARKKFQAQLAEQSSTQAGQIQEQMEEATRKLVSHSRTQLEEAANAAAGSFGSVLHGISDQESELFAKATRLALEERTQEFEASAQQLLHTLEASLHASIEGFQAQMASQMEKSVAEGRAELAAEFASALNGYRAECGAQQGEWAEKLDELCVRAADKFHERLQVSGDSWIVSSVRRLNEHGQNAIESLTRSADQSLRNSCSRIFEGLAEMLRERMTNAVGASFAPRAQQYEAPETSAPQKEDQASSELQ